MKRMPDPDDHCPIQAFIFDMDETLARTGPIWRDAEEHLLSKLRTTWSPRLAEKYKGMNALDVAATIHEEVQPSISRSDCRQIMRRRLIDNFNQAEIHEVEHACDLVQRCGAVGAPMVVASGSPAEAIELTLQALGIREQFRFTISSERVARGKPHPDVFLAAAEELSVPPGACLVFEDSLIGAQAARAAHMRCVVKPSLPNPQISSVATQTVSDWAKVDLDSFRFAEYP